MGKINYGKVLMGGIAAGIVAIVLMIFVIAPILMPFWEAGMKTGMWAQPTATRFLFDNAVLLAFGVVATFTYAAVRPRFGGSVQTAILAGILVALLKDVIPSLGRLNWSAMESAQSIILMMTLSGISTLVATFIGAWIYTE